jgi:hypothetical protein
MDTIFVILCTIRRIRFDRDQYRTQVVGHCSDMESAQRSVADLRERDGHLMGLREARRIMMEDWQGKNPSPANLDPRALDAEWERLSILLRIDIDDSVESAEYSIHESFLQT